jgi:hypothetical protein
MRRMDSNKIIDALGGTNEVARLCEIKPPSVSEWRRDGIPHARLMFLKLARPDVFAALEKVGVDDEQGAE